MERIVALGRGDKGDKGDAGEKGAPGPRLPRAQRQAIVWMFLANLAFIGVLTVGLFHYTGKLTDQQHVVAHQQHALARQQRELDEATAANSRQRCASVLAEAHIPLPHPIVGNPSRIWEAQFEALQATRARDLGCRLG